MTNTTDRGFWVILAITLLTMAGLFCLTYTLYGCKVADAPLPPRIVPPPLQACKLPPPPKLPKLERLPTTMCPQPAILCFDAKDSMNLILRDKRMRLWIENALLRCGGNQQTDSGKDAGVAPDETRGKPRPFRRSGEMRI